MFKNKTITKVLSFLLLLVIMIGYLPIGAIQAEASENITLNLESEPKIDVVLTKGVTNLNLTNFEKDLKNKLANKGIDISKVNISAIETQEIVANESNAQQIFSDWQNFSILGNGYETPKWTKEDFYISGNRLVRSTSGSTRPASGFYDPSPNAFATEDAEYNFTWGIHPTEYGSFYHGEAGFLFRMQDEKNYYAYLMDNHNACGNIQINGGEAIVKVTDGKFEILAQSNDFPMYHPGQTENIKIVTKGNNIKVYRNGSLKLNVNDNTYKNGTHGFYVWDQYGAYFSNISYSTEVTKKFSEVIREPQWRYGSKRFLVNLENNKVADFDNPSASGEILTRLINEEIHYLAIGSNTNKTQAESFIARNNNNGKFYSNSDYNAAIEGIADYIKNQMPTQESTGEEYVLMGEPMKVSVNPSHLMKNTQTPEYPQGRWRIDHDYEFYDNNLGQAIWANQWQKDLILTFDKPGKYEIFFENINPEPRFIYVHRRPVANFSLNVAKSGSNYNVSINDLSYDPDKEFSPDRGIAEYEWKWKETTATNWTNGRVPNTLPLGKNYIVQLRVKDHQGEWSIPEARYITTDNISTPPVANFNVSPNPLSMYVPLTVNDNSYDPAGKTITQREWVVTKNGTQVYKGSTPLTNFRPYGEGRYRISLRVKNSDNLWSEAYVREIEVTPDNTAPTSIVNPTRGGPTNENITVNIEFNDEGGSGFDSQRYAVTTSITPPTSGWSAWNTSKTRNIVLSQEGKLYIHIEAKDKAGNLHKRTVGEYHIDKTPPIITIGDYMKTPINKDIIVTASTNKGKLNVTSHTFTENGSFTFTATDKAGNKTSKTVTISNIDKTKPTKPSVKHEKNLIKLISGTDKESGIDKHMYQLDDGSWKVWTEDLNTNTLKDKVYVLKIKAIDKAGNESEVYSYTFEITREVKELAKTTRTLVEKAEETKLYSDINKAKDSLDLLKEKANKIVDKTIKTKLQNTINELENKLNALEKEVQEQLNSIDAKLNEIENQINTGIKDRQTVGKVQKLIDEAQELINKLPNKEDKEKAQEVLNELQQQLSDINDKLILEEFRKKIEDEDLNPEDVEKDIKEIEDSDIKEKYIEEVKEVIENQLKNLEDIINKIEQEGNLPKLVKEGKELIDKTEKFIKTLPKEKQPSYSKQLKELENKYNKFVNSKIRNSKYFSKALLYIQRAEKYTCNFYIKRAQELVNELQNGWEKNSLQLRLDKVKTGFYPPVKTELKEAEETVEKAEKYKSNFHIKQAQKVINKLEDGPEKEELQERLNALTNNSKNKNSSTKKAEEAVKKAEKYKSNFHIREAQKAINKLEDGLEKEELQKRLDTLK